MHVVYLGVLAGPDISIVVLMLLSLLGAALLALLAWASSGSRQGAVGLRPAPVTLPRYRSEAVRPHPEDLLRSCGTTRAPPGYHPPRPALGRSQIRAAQDGRIETVS